MNLADLSNEQVLSGLHATIAQGRMALSRLLVYLGEVEHRRLDLESACSSLFDFCQRRLGMGDDEAYRRVAGARLVRRFPIALGMIERGELHLTALLLLREYLTEDNHEELLCAAARKTKSEVQHLLAERYPRPDAPSRIRSLPGASVPMPPSSGAAPTPSGFALQAPASRVQPLSPERYRVEFSAGADLREKLERAADLMRHVNPSGDLSVVVDRALDLLLTQLEKQRLGKATRPSKSAPGESTRTGYVRRAVRRAVFERDGTQCTFTDDQGRRCQSRAFLELDHRHPRALGGADDASNLSVRCRAHNRLSAERQFGREHVEHKQNQRKIHPHQRGHGPTPRPGGNDDVVLRALCGMGFAHREARRALTILQERRASSQPPPLETLIREALSVLA